MKNRCLLELLSYPVLFTFLQYKCDLISRITGKLIKWLLVVINTLSVIICQIFYIVFHKLQLVLTLHWYKNCVLVFFSPCLQHVCDIFWRSFSGRLSSTFHFLYLDQNETRDCGPKWKTHSVFLQSSSSTCKELPDYSFLVSSG